MTKIKTKDLSGTALDWAVECALGTFWSPNGYFCFDKKPGFNNGYPFQSKPEWRYSADWSQGGPIIEREAIDLLKVTDESWRARHRLDLSQPTTIQHGPTPLIAAMRCYVASKLGDEVDVPEEPL